MKCLPQAHVFNGISGLQWEPLSWDVARPLGLASRSESFNVGLDGQSSLLPDLPKYEQALQQAAITPDQAAMNSTLPSSP